MPAQSLVYVMTRASPCLLPRAPCQSSIIPCKCCQRSVWYKLGIMGDQTPKIEGKEKKRRKQKIQNSAHLGVCSESAQPSRY